MLNGAPGCVRLMRRRRSELSGPVFAISSPKRFFNNGRGYRFVFRAYAEAGPSVQHSEQQGGGEDDFVSDSEAERSVESCSDDEAKDDGAEGKKRKMRSGFRDRKVISSS